MNGRGFITISMRELDRLKVIQAIVELGLKPALRSLPAAIGNTRRAD